VICSSGLILVVLNDRLPTQEGICHRVNDIPGVVAIGLAIANRGYIPPRPCESGDIHHFLGGVTSTSIRTTLSTGLGVPEGVAHNTIQILSHQTANMLISSHAACGIALTYSALISSHQTTDKVNTIDGAASSLPVISFPHRSVTFFLSP